jgi:hypothetical protein
MNYYSPNSLPALHTLGLEFAVCDHWFSSLPGPTWPNRLFAMTGTSLGRVTMPSGIMDFNLHWYDQSTVFDRLNEQGISWKLYIGDIAVSMILVHQWDPQNAICHRPMLEFFFDVASTDSDKFPEFVWIEPSYLPPMATYKLTLEQVLIQLRQLGFVPKSGHEAVRALDCVLKPLGMRAKGYPLLRQKKYAKIRIT